MKTLKLAVTIALAMFINSAPAVLEGGGHRFAIDGGSNLSDEGGSNSLPLDEGSGQFTEGGNTLTSPDGGNSFTFSEGGSN